MSAWMDGLLGGALIGISASLLLWLDGRIAGISGMVNGLTGASTSDRGWRVAFLIGLMLVGGLMLHGLPMVPPRTGFSATLLVVAGLLVGFGTSMGSGCTSGHGVCGLGRLSMRSLVAVLVFMFTAMVTVFVARHLLGVA